MRYLSGVNTILKRSKPPILLYFSVITFKKNEIIAVHLVLTIQISDMNYIKLIIPIVIAVVLYFAGMFTQSKLTKQPICNCPEVNIPKCPSAVSVNGMDISELKKLKIRGGFQYSPTFQADNMYIIQGADTSKVK